MSLKKMVFKDDNKQKMGKLKVSTNINSGTFIAILKTTKNVVLR